MSPLIPSGSAHYRGAPPFEQLPHLLFAPPEHHLPRLKQADRSNSVGKARHTVHVSRDALVLNVLVDNNLIGKRQAEARLTLDDSQ